jgi:anti-sigma factor RsiW
MDVYAKCPSTERLSALLTGDLTPAAERQALAHLDACAACQRRIEELGGSGGWRDWRGLTRPAAAPALRCNGCCPS